MATDVYLSCFRDHLRFFSETIDRHVSLAAKQLKEEMTYVYLCQ